MAKRTAVWRAVFAMVVVSAAVTVGTVITAIEVAQPVSAAGAISLTTLGSPYAQSFDTLASTGTSSVVPDGWAFVETGTNANTRLARPDPCGRFGDLSDSCIHPGEGPLHRL